MQLENLKIKDLNQLTAEQLRHIIANQHAVAHDIFIKAQQLIPIKIKHRRAQIEAKLNEINQFASTEDDFEVDIHGLSQGKMIIGFSECCSFCGYTFELIFEEPYHYSGNIWYFKINTQTPFIRLATEEEQGRFNAKFELIQFNQTFIIEAEDQKPIYISCKDIHLETDKQKMHN